jgi:drug/metabolite transporter (DMT)-like permease
VLPLATALALVAAAIFALSTVLQQRGGLNAPPLSLRHPASFVHLADETTWLAGMLLLVPGWTLQAMALDRGRVAVIQPIFTMTVVFVLPLGYWLTNQTVTRAQVGEALLVVFGLGVFIVLGSPAGGRDDAPNWQWFVAIVVLAGLSSALIAIGDGSSLSVRAGAFGTAAGIGNGLAATLTKPVVETLHASGLGGVLSGWKLYALVAGGVLGVVFQQIALQTARLAPAVATGAVVNPLVGVTLGIVLLQERLAPPAWHKLLAFGGLGLALAASVAIALAKERRAGTAVAVASAVSAEP